jgi:hypothetical protein
MALPKKGVLERVMQRASQDSEFRARLLDEPIGPLAEMLGAVPSNLRIKFIERPSDLDALIVLPDMRADGHLTQFELESVAGGEGYAWDTYRDDQDEPSER